jgi:hypothetical protein
VHDPDRANFNLRIIGAGSRLLRRDWRCVGLDASAPVALAFGAGGGSLWMADKKCGADRMARAVVKYLLFSD